VLARLPAVARRAGLLSLLLVALIVPGTARAADTFEFNILRNRCTNTGHDFGHGEILLKVKVKENGASGANKFTLAAVAQHYKKRTQTWINEYAFDRFKVTFPDDANSYYHTRWFAYDPKDKSQHRIVVTIKVWHNKKLLASKALTSRSC
jgi:hypothetical protein